MPRIIKQEQVIDDPWQLLTLADEQTPANVALPAGPTLLPLAVWLARRDELLSAGTSLGVWLAANEGPEKLAADVHRFAVIGVDFPKFTDGRSYSTARLLRERYAYRGEIRAIGDVLQDQLFYMRRCGIDAYALRADKDPDKALASLRVFSDSYQAAVDQPQPLFRRRLAKEAR
ncbi:MAG TPA: DUF934 domain-containing protein [Accumulibacter sp.]|nr:DUF934 domain-containing protein [Accumulibacter sp.]HMW17329.1 DUF934 domain-containing protein [Accumulibacter sp.]HMX23398.1 DUF934 domain-containing protein [Accumulibacter sp.]HNC17498.1 DUF934 domain-containing protein [Accumulibacter sp.]HND80076.1 DUF934 domain-containing protein [Accumulibacter sp.]